MAFHEQLTIGVLEDDLTQQELYCQWLQEVGMEPKSAAHGHEFLQLARNTHLDLAIIDWFLPDTNGLEVVQSLRSDGLHQGPIIIATILDSEETIVKALDLGADDYLVKPITKALLLARIRAATRRFNFGGQANLLKFRHVSIDLSASRIWLNDAEIEVSTKDFQLISCFFRNLGRLLTREYLLKTVWGINAELDTRTVDVHVSRIRRLLRLRDGSGFRLVAVYSRGYRLEASEDWDNMHTFHTLDDRG